MKKLNKKTFIDPMGSQGDELKDSDTLNFYRKIPKTIMFLQEWPGRF